MPIVWQLHKDRPMIEVVVSGESGEQHSRLVADTGAGNCRSKFEIVLEDWICRRTGSMVIGQIRLGGAYSGWFDVYLIEVRIPALQFVDSVPVVGVTTVPAGFDGIAGFRFLNRFHFGNFADPDQFGLE